MITTLRIHKKYDNSLEVAIRWYSIISILNDFQWRPLEIKILAFTAVKGDISSGGRKKAFCELFHSPETSVANSVSDLYKAGFLTKKEGKTRVSPEFLINFEGEIISRINISHA